MAATLIIVLLFITCSNNSPETVENQPEELKQESESPVSTDEKETTPETPPATVIQFERERSFGSTDEVMMGQMGPFAVGPNGEVFLSDSDQSTIHVFQSDGSYVKSLGRKGR